MMYKIILFSLLFGLFAANVQGQQIQWMSMNEALEAQEKEPRKIFLDAYTQWCGPCKMLDRNTFSNEDVAAFLNKNYYPVKFNAEGNERIVYKDKVFVNPEYNPKQKGRNSQHEFARALKIRAYPSLVFFDEQGDLIGPIPGYRTPQQLELFLKLFLKEDYKEITTPEAFRNYSENFNPEFESH